MPYVHKNSRADNELAVSRGFLSNVLRTDSIISYVVVAAFVNKVSKFDENFSCVFVCFLTILECCTIVSRVRITKTLCRRVGIRFLRDS